MWNAIAEQISAATGETFRLANARPVGGGCINEAHRLDGEGGPFFCKHNRADKRKMLEAEADGRRDNAAPQTNRVPPPVCHRLS
ncbi:MAG: fructosamine kinase family protein, partial [Verrucomicrobiota bacterium]|nr:fructosamine kinase family protein [Verrucomicrobiota bacterium]